MPIVQIITLWNYYKFEVRVLSRWPWHPAISHNLTVALQLWWLTSVSSSVPVALDTCNKLCRHSRTGKGRSTTSCRGRTSKLQCCRLAHASLLVASFWHPGNPSCHVYCDPLRLWLAALFDVTFNTCLGISGIWRHASRKWRNITENSLSFLAFPERLPVYIQGARIFWAVKATV